MSPLARHALPVMPPKNHESIDGLSDLLHDTSHPAALVGPNGERVPLPAEIHGLLVEVVDAMQAGKAITVAPVDQRLTTQQAADLLGISRPTLIKVLDEGGLEYETPAGGRHRRLRLTDVLEYQAERRSRRRAILDKITRESAEDDLYSTDAADYREALRDARHSG